MRRTSNRQTSSGGAPDVERWSTSAENASEKLLARLFIEFFQTEESALEHPRMEAARLGDILPARATRRVRSPGSAGDGLAGVVVDAHHLEHPRRTAVVDRHGVHERTAAPLPRGQCDGGASSRGEVRARRAKSSRMATRSFTAAVGLRSTRSASSSSKSATAFGASSTRSPSSSRTASSRYLPGGSPARSSPTPAGTSVPFQSITLAASPMPRRVTPPDASRPTRASPFTPPTAPSASRSSIASPTAPSLDDALPPRRCSRR